MSDEKIKAFAEKYKAEMIEQYPKYTEITEESFGIIEEMLFDDYDSYSSDAKKLRQFKRQLSSLIENAFVENGRKNYMKSTIRFFSEDVIKQHFCGVFNTEGGNFVRLIETLISYINYWQGFEGMEHKKLEQLLKVTR